MRASTTGTLLLIFAFSCACGDPNDTLPAAEEKMSTVRSFERDGQIVDEFVVGNRVLQIPRAYAVIYSTPNNLNVAAHWPGLVSSGRAHNLPSTSRINVIFQPQDRYANDVDQQTALLEYIERLALIGPEKNEDIALVVFRDDEGRRRLMISTDHVTPFGNQFHFTCAAASNRDAKNQECRASYKLTEDLHMEYRFNSDLMPQWREIDVAVRGFGLSMIGED